jgi:DivIVA domain-containing protein
MTFMPEDVLKKSFTSTQFRRGYHEHEVDEFLDEIVVEMRRMSSEKEELGAQLKAYREGKAVIPAEIQEKISAARVSAENAEKDAAARIAKARADAQQAESQAAERVKSARESADELARSSLAGSAPAAAKDEHHGTAEVDGAAASSRAAGVSPVVEKANEQYASNGQSRDYSFLGESAAGQIGPPSTAAAKYEMLSREETALQEQMFAEAREQSTAMVAEVRQKSAEVLLALGCERSLLQQKSTEVLQAIGYEQNLVQRKIDELRAFESDRRARLKAQLQDQLLELERTGTDERADDRSRARGSHGG